ncbi:MAG: tRNA (adenosine(37)-N6)-threonylcarbamoyltransferase complex dimerization subunit type 1 TsaB [Candidatus Limnocylindria bacterium]
MRAAGAVGRGHDGRRHGILAIDTATSRALVATGTPDGVVDGIATWVVGYRHGETLLPTIGRFLGEQNLRRSRLVGIVVGTGPGAFTGLRVGIATAKGLAHGLRIPLVGVSTAGALLHAAGPAAVLLQPAGPRDRVLSRPDAAAQLLSGDGEPALADGEVLVAVDLDGRAPADAVERGTAAWDGLGAALIELGAARLAELARSAPDDRRGDLDTLVPEYVTLPRGVAAATGEVAWSRDPR